jgi:radical SAM protein with 4Fe4S-binding SPASM domain
MWELGIPHVTIIAGKSPEATTLVRAVERAEDLGMIAGVRACGSVLGRGTLIRDLAWAGVDHLNVLYLAADAGRHDSLAGVGGHEQAIRVFGLARENEVCPVAEIALTRATAAVVDDTIRSLKQHGVETAALFALASTAEMAPGNASDAALAGDALIQVAGTVEETADAADVRVLWYPPVGLQPGSSLAEQACEGPRSSGDTAVRIEPDGTVIAARGPYLAGGNIMTDPWSRIHTSAAFLRYRARVEHDTHCGNCPGLVICSADCPRNSLGWAHGRAEPLSDSSQLGQTSFKEGGHEG